MRARRLFECEVFIRRKPRQRRRDDEHAHLSKHTNGCWKYFKSVPKKGATFVQAGKGMRDRYLSPFPDHGLTTIDRVFKQMGMRHLIRVFDRYMQTGSNAY